MKPIWAATAVIAYAVLAPPVLLAAGLYAAVKTGRLEYIRED